MVTVRRKPDPEVMEAYQLIGEPGHQVVLRWIETHGYEKVNENLDDPLVLPKYRSQIAAGKKMWFVNHMGQVVLMHGHFASNASYGDWIISRGMDVPLQVMKPPAFDALYEEV